ncbi:MAG TPA: septal ring lytic transglycosylase RlpA family protein [Candidatus Omnitrophota bacterium]|nr:septal ring lytic transglycosylase RlpA family protein [Candidatus Omnitrophota bacterium]
MSIASWYGEKYRGKRTASGERFDPMGLTAAHPSLPFGTRLRVTGADGRDVVVRINDRGPFDRPGGIDLSQAAARRIGLTGTGPVLLSPADDVQVAQAQDGIAPSGVAPWWLDVDDGGRTIHPRGDTR